MDRFYTAMMVIVAIVAIMIVLISPYIFFLNRVGAQYG